MGRLVDEPLFRTRVAAQGTEHTPDRSGAQEDHDDEQHALVDEGAVAVGDRDEKRDADARGDEGEA